MAFSPLISTSFGNPGLVPLVLSDPTFAKRGYLWGDDGAVHYCFVNPKKLSQTRTRSTRSGG